jgi:dTDP-4-amino-4,6-dideoxygalactose transaminase
MIPFNKPYVTGQELEYLRQSVETGKISGDGPFTRRCHAWLEKRLGGGKALLTSSCTDALEAAALLCDIEPGDEVVMPSYTFVSTATAFVLRGARIRFIDSQASHPNLDASRIEEVINERTRAIVAVHYAGMACDMDAIGALAERHGLRVVEDAAQAIDSFYRGRPLGTLGDLAAFSFHETKNIVCGEGGALHVNDPALAARAEIVREKGTNRSSFFRGEVDKYGWVDTGSSYLPSDLTAAFLLAQMEACDRIQARRHAIWERYQARLAPLAQAGDAELPCLPQGSSHNAHMFYLICPSLAVRDLLIQHLKTCGVSAVFHYQSLHASRFYAARHDGRPLPNADRFTDCLLRLPLFYELSDEQVDHVAASISEFFTRRRSAC